MGAVVLFDGVCNFCDSSVNFIIDHDPEGYFKFAPLQSEVGRELAAKHGFRSEAASPETTSPDNDLVPIDSVILIEHDKVYAHSSAALRIAKKLSGIWPVLFGLMVIPRALRDYFYRLFAKHRYRIFGRKEACMIPTPEVRARFL